MSVQVYATYSNGVLQLDEPLALHENVRVRVTVHATIGRPHRDYGLLGRLGKSKILAKIAQDPEFGVTEER